MNTNPALPVVVIGAGPVGLAAAAHLHHRGIPFVVFEVGDDVGASVREWSHVRLFSPWSHDIDPIAAELLGRNGWSAPDPGAHPTGAELIEQYLQPLAGLPEIATSIRTNRIVTAVTRQGVDKVTDADRADRPFIVTTDGPHGVERTAARAVIDASGNWYTPNPLGADGRRAEGEHPERDVIEYGIPDVLGRDRRRYVRRRVAVVGSGHSAQNLVRDLAALVDQDGRTTVTWILRRAGIQGAVGVRRGDLFVERERLGVDARSSVDDGSVEMVAGFRTERISDGPSGSMLHAEDGRVVGPFDRVIVATGFRPDLTMLSELRVDVDPALESARSLAPLIDPSIHTCGSVPVHGAAELAHPEPGLYVVGAKSYGRAPTFLLSTGYQQVRSVVAEVAGVRVATDASSLTVDGCATATVDSISHRPGDHLERQDAIDACCS